MIPGQVLFERLVPSIKVVVFVRSCSTVSSTSGAVTLAERRYIFCLCKSTADPFNLCYSGNSASLRELLYVPSSAKGPSYLN